MELGRRQAKYQAGSDPAKRFMALLQAALESGQAHVADRQGRAPVEAGGWGWKPGKAGRGWISQGACIGWVVDNDLYLDPRASYRAAQGVAGTEPLQVSAQALRHRLRECGLLISLDTGRAACCRSVVPWPDNRVKYCT